MSKPGQLPNYACNGLSKDTSSRLDDQPVGLSKDTSSRLDDQPVGQVPDCAERARRLCDQIKALLGPTLVASPGQDQDALLTVIDATQKLQKMHDALLAAGLRQVPTTGLRQVPTTCRKSNPPAPSSHSSRSSFETFRA